MSLGRYVVWVFLLCISFSAVAQRETLPNTNVPLNQVDAQGKRDGPWWVTPKARKGEPVNAEFGNYDHGTKYGKWYKIDHDGDIVAVETYRNDMLDGEVKDYTKGILYCIGNYKVYRSGADVDTIMVVDAETHEQSLKEILGEYYTVRQGHWRFYDEQTGKLLRTEEYDLDSLVSKNNYISPSDSAKYRQKELAMPHNKKKYRKANDAGRKEEEVN